MYVVSLAQKRGIRFVTIVWRRINVETSLTDIIRESCEFTITRNKCWKLGALHEVCVISLADRTVLCVCTCASTVPSTSASASAGTNTRAWPYAAVASNAGLGVNSVG